MYLKAKYLSGVIIKWSASSITCGLSSALLYSSVNIDEAATIAWTQFWASSEDWLATITLIEDLKDGCAAAYHIIFWLSVSAWLNIL